MDSAEFVARVRRRREAGAEVAAVQAVLDKFRLDGPFSCFKISGMVGPAPDFSPLLLCFWRAPDAGGPDVGHFRTLARVADPTDEAGVVKLARDLARATVLHELDEMIVVDGDRPFFPHRGDPADRDPFILERRSVRESNPSTPG